MGRRVHVTGTVSREDAQRHLDSFVEEYKKGITGGGALLPCTTLTRARHAQPRAMTRHVVPPFFRTHPALRSPACLVSPPSDIARRPLTRLAHAQTRRRVPQVKTAAAQSAQPEPE
jgi:hypothetical protein